MHRFLRSIAVVLVVSLLFQRALCADEETLETTTEANAAVTDGEKRVVSLEDRLATGLKVRRPEDVAFLEQVAQRVQEGKLPRKIVDSTYLWALRRRQSYPFPSFQKALRLQAERIGVDLE
ncbi:MAG: hypothetical protein DWH79_12680 [Planctomycetota bacterium]|nr:MAG: hypothetical protein DWH79_12680 [Planctomycetota bacterium]